jgi:HPr kinase/phosphorylase
VGVVNVTHLFGISAIRDRQQIQFVIELEDWDPNKDYERVGDDDLFLDILGINVHKIVIPVKPGRNTSVIIETAVLNEKLKNMGYNSAKEFNRNIQKWIESERSAYVYFGQDDII